MCLKITQELFRVFELLNCFLSGFFDLSDVSGIYASVIYDGINIGEDIQNILGNSLPVLGFDILELSH